MPSRMSRGFAKTVLQLFFSLDPIECNNSDCLEVKMLTQILQELRSEKTNIKHKRVFSSDPIHAAAPVTIALSRC